VTTTSGTETVVLRGGLVVPLATLHLLWDMEARGLRLRLAQDGALVVSPKFCITALDDAAIRDHRAELVALVKSQEIM
jgi:hypothetical protein